MTISNINKYNSYTPAAKTTATESDTKTYADTSDYLSELQKQYPFAGGTSKIGNVSTSVSISSSLLRDCLNDPEKQAWLERNLAAIPDGVSKIANNPSGTLHQVSISIDAQGNVSSTSYGTFSSDSNESFLDRMLREAKEAAEEKAEKLVEKRAEEKSAARPQPYSFVAKADDVDSLLEQIQARMQNGFTGGGLQSSIDLRA